MNDDTPLPEVAEHLPQEAAAFLDVFPTEVQIPVLTQLRGIIAYWERSEMVFDPVAYAAFITALVPSIAPLYQSIYEMHAKLAGAQHLIDTMTQTLADGGSP